MGEREKCIDSDRGRLDHLSSEFPETGAKIIREAIKAFADNLDNLPCDIFGDVESDWLV
jgi:hypothetical protein